MLFIFLTPVSIIHLLQLKTVAFLHWCLICTVHIDNIMQQFVLKKETLIKMFGVISSNPKLMN